MSDQFQPGPQGGPPAGPVGSFEFNKPTIVSLLYLASVFTGITFLVGGVLAYVWKGEPHEPWEDSHYRYLVRTFWIGVIGTLVGLVLAVIVIGLLVLAAAFVLVVVRSVLAMIRAQKREAMPNPDTWLA